MKRLENGDIEVDGKRWVKLDNPNASYDKWELNEGVSILYFFGAFELWAINSEGLFRKVKAFPGFERAAEHVGEL